MQVQVVNSHARRRYEDVRTAIEMVRLALEESARLHRDLSTVDAGRGGWRVPPKEDVVAAYSKAVEQLNALRESTRKWEKELVSRGWRV